MSATRYSRLPPDSRIAVLLTACAGSVDAFAFFALGHAFAGIVTGNLVTTGYGLATGNASLVRPTVTAVAACVAGEVTWARLLNRRPDNALPLLIAENVLLLMVLVTWLGTDEHPHGIITLSMLAVASVAIGGQSICALRIHQTTTYFTGMLTTAVKAAAGGSLAKTGVSLRQLGALITRGRTRMPNAPGPAFCRARAASRPARRDDHDPGPAIYPRHITLANR